jgi:hypothetical protein
LRPGGRLIFFELGLSPDIAVQRWQRQLEPLYHWMFQGLYLTRDIPSLIVDGGFQIEQMRAGYLPHFRNHHPIVGGALRFRKRESSR